MPVRAKTLAYLRGHADQLSHPADQVTNLREDILNHRLLYSLTSLDDEQGEIYLNKAARALEK
jgi:hypothetical protein